MKNPLQPVHYQERRATMLPATKEGDLEADVDGLLNVLLPIARRIALQKSQNVVESTPRKSAKFV